MCGHDFQRTIKHIVNNRWCPYCSENLVCDNDDCEYVIITHLQVLENKLIVN